ncbi:MAG: hypothetical protein AB7I98_14030 [Verrucomicrobiales bacterium]
MNPLPTIDGLDLRLVLSHVDDLAGAVAGRPQWGGLAKADQAAAAAEALRFRALGRELEARLLEAETAARRGEAGEAVEILLRPPSVPLMGRCLDGLGAERIASWDAWCVTQGLPASGVTLRSEGELEDDPENRDWTDEAGAAFRRLASWPRLAEWLKQARELPGEAREGYGEALAEARAARDRGDEEACGENLARALAAAEALALLEEPPDAWRDQVAELRHGLLPAWVARCLSECEPEDAPALAEALMNSSLSHGVPVAEIKGRMGPSDALLVRDWQECLSTEVEVEVGVQGSPVPTKDTPSGTAPRTEPVGLPNSADLARSPVQPPPLTAAPPDEEGVPVLRHRSARNSLSGRKRPYRSRQRLLPVRIWAASAVVFLMVISITFIALARAAKNRESEQRIAEIYSDLERGDFDLVEARLEEAFTEGETEPRLEKVVEVLNARSRLRAYLEEVAHTASESELPSLDAGSAGGRGHPLLVAAWEQVQIFERLKSRPTGFSDAGVAQIRRWLHVREASSLPPAERRRVFERLGMASEWAEADHSMTERARAWVDHYVVIKSDQTLADLRILLEAPGAKELFPGLEKVVLEKLEVVVLQEKFEEPLKTTLVHKVTTKTLHEITNITIERPDGAGYFRLPSIEFRETAKVALMSLPLEHAKLWDGRIHLLASKVNPAMATARPLRISKSYVKIEGDLSEQLGEVSADGLSFKPSDSQPLAFVEGEHFRVLLFPGWTPVETDYAAATEVIATEEQLIGLIPIAEAPDGWAHLEATYGKGNPVASISLPLPEGMTLGAAIAEAFQKPANPASSDEAGNKVGAQLFKRWFWDPPLTGKGGLLEGVQGLRKVPHTRDKVFLGYSNTPFPLGISNPDTPIGLTQIDTFVIQIKGFPDFIDSPYHTGNMDTLAGITAQFLSELSKNLYHSKEDLLTSAEKLKVGPDSRFPNQYFPWDQNVILASMGKRQNLKELVKDFGEIAAGTATGFKEDDYNVTQDPVTNLPHTNHQILNKRFHELGKDLPQIAAFLEWADKVFPPGTTPAKERFEKALEEAIGAGEKDKKAKDEKDKKLEAIAKGDLTEVKVKLILSGFRNS